MGLIDWCFTARQHEVDQLHVPSPHHTGNTVRDCGTDFNYSCKRIIAYRSELTLSLGKVDVNSHGCVKQREQNACMNECLVVFVPTKGSLNIYWKDGHGCLVMEVSILHVPLTVMYIIRDCCHLLSIRIKSGP